jgi:hypothetical protein
MVICLNYNIKKNKIIFLSLIFSNDGLLLPCFIGISLNTADGSAVLLRRVPQHGRSIAYKQEIDSACDNMENGISLSRNKARNGIVFEIEFTSARYIDVT